MIQLAPAVQFCAPPAVCTHVLPGVTVAKISTLAMLMLCVLLVGVVNADAAAAGVATCT
jgi:hypothetical protein